MVALELKHYINTVVLLFLLSTVYKVYILALTHLKR